MRNGRPFAFVATLLAIPLLLCPNPPWSAASGIDANSELSHYGIDFWQEAQGFPSTRIRGIIQARDGYLWMATFSGLVRFDGVSFALFNLKTGSLKYDEVWGLKEDKAGGPGSARMAVV